MQFGKLVAIVLAGNDENPRIFGGLGQPSKFFLPFGPERVGDRILRAIGGLDGCKAICLAAPAGARQQAFAVHLPLHTVPQGATRTQSLANAVHVAQARGYYRDGDRVLVVAGDLPLLTTSALERFMSACREAPEADLYLGMIPVASIPEELLPGYRRDLLPFCGTLCLHADVYLMRPAAVTPVGYRRFEEIVTMRRSDLHHLGGIARVVMMLVKIVGLQGLLAFARILLAMGRRTWRARKRPRSGLDVIEKITQRLIERRFGPRVSFVVVEESSLGLEFDHPAQLELLTAYAIKADNADDAPPFAKSA
jgi:molybdopterin-guanine dinucleotide biosynthesis protein A